MWFRKYINWLDNNFTELRSVTDLKNKIVLNIIK